MNYQQQRDIEKEIYNIQRELELANIELIRWGELELEGEDYQNRLDEISNKIEELTKNLNQVITKL